MRNLDVVAKEKFGGDIEKTIEFLLLNGEDNNFDKYVDELTYEEAQMVMKIMNAEAIKHYGSERNYQMEIKKNRLLMELDLTEEEVKNATKNPYKAKILKSSLIMLIMEGGIIALSLFGNSLGFTPAMLGVGASIATGLSSVTLASNIIGYVKFKNAKKFINNHQITNELNYDSRKRGL